LSDGDWSSTTNGAMTVYGEGTSTVYSGSDDEVSNLADYGRLYNWYAVDDSRGLCPSGWHVPTDAEYITLTDDLGGLAVAGDQMKSSTAWNGTNTSGFSGLAGGMRVTQGAFALEGINGRFWSASATPNPYYAWGRTLYDGSPDVGRPSSPLGEGYSVRCVRD